MMDHRADFARLDTLGFRSTPRRREVLRHIAYEPIQWAKYFHHAGSASMVVWKPIVTGSDVHAICQLLNRCRLVRWPPGSRDIWITPFGMEVLLNGIPHKDDRDAHFRDRRAGPAEGYEGLRISPD